MKCDMDYCIYNLGFTCMLQEIQIDSCGLCDSCELAAIPPKQLERCKKKRLKEIKKIWRGYDG